MKLTAGADITLADDGTTKITIGLRQSFDLYNSETGEAIWDSSNLIDHIGSLTLAADGKIELDKDAYGTLHARKYLTNLADMDLTKQGLKDLAFKDWIVGYQYSVGPWKGAGRFNISKWLGYDG